MALLTREEADFMTIKGGTMSHEDEARLSSILDSIAASLQKIETAAGTLAKAQTADKELARALLVAAQETTKLKDEGVDKMEQGLPYVPKETIESLRTAAESIEDLCISKSPVSKDFREVEVPARLLKKAIADQIAKAQPLPASGPARAAQEKIDKSCRSINNIARTAIAKGPDTAARIQKHADDIVSKMQALDKETGSFYEMLLIRRDIDKAADKWAVSARNAFDGIESDVRNITILNKDKIPANLATSIAGFTKEARPRLDKIPSSSPGCDSSLFEKAKEALSALESKTQSTDSPVMVTIKTQVTEITKQGESIIRRLDIILTPRQAKPGSAGVRRQKVRGAAAPRGKPQPSIISTAPAMKPETAEEMRGEVKSMLSEAQSILDSLQGLERAAKSKSVDDLKKWESSTKERIYRIETRVREIANLAKCKPANLYFAINDLYNAMYDPLERIGKLAGHELKELTDYALPNMHLAAYANALHPIPQIDTETEDLAKIAEAIQHVIADIERNIAQKAGAGATPGAVPRAAGPEPGIIDRVRIRLSAGGLRKDIERVADRLEGFKKDVDEGKAEGVKRFISESGRDLQDAADKLSLMTMLGRQNKPPHNIAKPLLEQTEEAIRWVRDWIGEDPAPITKGLEQLKTSCQGSDQSYSPAEDSEAGSRIADSMRKIAEMFKSIAKYMPSPGNAPGAGPSGARPGASTSAQPENVRKLLDLYSRFVEMLKTANKDLEKLKTSAGKNDAKACEEHLTKLQYDIYNLTKGVGLATQFNKGRKEHAMCEKIKDSIYQIRTAANAVAWPKGCDPKPFLDSLTALGTECEGSNVSDALPHQLVGQHAEGVGRELGTMLRLFAALMQESRARRKGELEEELKGVSEAARDIEAASKEERKLLEDLNKEASTVGTDLIAKRAEEEAMLPAIMRELQEMTKMSGQAREKKWLIEPAVQKMVAALERYKGAGIDVDKVRADFEVKSWIARLAGQKDDLKEILSLAKHEKELIRKSYKRMADIYAILKKRGGDQAKQADQIYKPFAALWTELDRRVSAREMRIYELQTRLMDLPNTTVKSTYSSIKDIVEHINSIEKTKDHPKALAAACEDLARFVANHRRLVETVKAAEGLLGQIRQIDVAGQLKLVSEGIKAIEERSRASR